MRTAVASAVHIDRGTGGMTVCQHRHTADQDQIDSIPCLINVLPEQCAETVKRERGQIREPPQADDAAARRSDHGFREAGHETQALR